jgi:RimJ/RimL family protein N-acetyltransferase
MRLDLVASTPQKARAESSDRSRFLRLLDTHVPPRWPPPLIDEGVLRWNADFPEANPGPAGWTKWTILFRADNDTWAVSSDGFKGEPDSAGGLEVGYSVLEERQGQGYATEAVQALVEWALSNPEVQVVEAETDREGLSSVRVLEECGFSVVAGFSEKGLVRYQRQKEPLCGA